MLTGGQFYDVLCAVVPLYVALFLGYGSLKWWGVVTPEQSAGVSRVNALVAMPALVFEIIAFNDPYTMDNYLIAAYCLSNVIVLVALCAWAWCTKRGDGLDWVITLFQASVMPNTIIVGIPVLAPLFTITGSGIAAIFIGQVLWLYPILLFYELRAVKNLGHAPAQVVQDDAHESVVTAPERRHDHPPHGIPALMSTDSATSEHYECRIKIGGDEANVKERDLMHVTSIRSNAHCGHDAENGDTEMESNGHVDVEVVATAMNWKDMAIRVGKKMLRLPFTYATLLGIIYSLIAGRWSFGPPRILRNSLDIIGRITLGLTMYNIGLFMALGQKKLVTSWWVAFYGALCRFVVGPGAMGLASFLLGLRGDTLRFAFLQAALPQAVISFVFARDYNLHTDVFTTAVSFQTVIFMPIVLAYYTLLEL